MKSKNNCFVALSWSYALVFGPKGNDVCRQAFELLVLFITWNIWNKKLKSRFIINGTYMAKILVEQEA